MCGDEWQWTKSIDKIVQMTAKQIHTQQKCACSYGVDQIQWEMCFGQDVIF